jgi:hypothetical protein
MKKTSGWFLAIFFLSGLQCAQTLDEILAKNYQARGGLEKLRALIALKIKGKVILPGQAMELSMVMWQKNSNTMRVESTFQKKLIIQAYDGQKAWRIISFISADAQEMSQEESQQFKEQADFENPLVVYKEKGYKLELLGKEDLEGTPVFKLKLTKTDGREIYFYLDAASGIELKSTMVLKSVVTESINEIIFADYKSVKGLLMPFYIENKTNGKTQMQMTMETIEINPAIDDAFFVMPLKKDEAKVAGQK